MRRIICGALPFAPGRMAGGAFDEMPRTKIKKKRFSECTQSSEIFRSPLPNPSPGAPCTRQPKWSRPLHGSPAASRGRQRLCFVLRPPCRASFLRVSASLSFASFCSRARKNKWTAAHPLSHSYIAKYYGETKEK